MWQQFLIKRQNIYTPLKETKDISGLRGELP
jgi:hypothetical protein